MKSSLGFIPHDTYKDRPAIRITTSTLSALFLPDDGGKLVSVTAQADGFEFLCQNPASTYARLAYDGAYVDSECSSFDDMFPTIDPYTPAEGVYAGVNYPDHGEICRLPMEAVTDGETLTLSCTSRLFPITYRKTISAEKEDGSLLLTYAIENHGKTDLPYIWAAHCMLRGTDDLIIRTPYAPDAPVLYMFGPDGRELLPRDRLTGYAPTTGAAYKYYYTEPTDGGFVEGTYTVSGHSILLDYRESAALLPYLGIWINNGSFRDYYNIAPEFATAPYDSPDRAAEAGALSVLSGGETLRFAVRIQVR